VKSRAFRLLTLAVVLFAAKGCTGGKLDFCTLLTMEEVARFDSDIISSEMGVRNPEAPTNYCIYKNNKNEDVFLLSIGTATKNLPYNILKTYFPGDAGTDTVELIEGVGTSAAALFSDDYPADRFRILIANGDEWSVTIRAKGIRDKDSERFLVLKDLANKALTRF
jgi:hypothetical protein